MRGIEKLPGYQEIISHWDITNYSYDYLMDETSDRKVFMYLDPPYDIKDNLYGKRVQCTKDLIMTFLLSIVMSAR